MPLSNDTGKKGVESNIAELRQSGYPQRQAVAIALSHRKQVRAKKAHR